MEPAHRCTLRALVAMVAIAATATAAHAHDYWLLPAQLVLPGDGEVAISQYVGEDFVAHDERALKRARFPRLVHLHAGASEDLAASAVDGAKPMLRVSMRGGGGHLIVADRNASNIEMAPGKFETYLEHEGLGAIVKERALLGESQKPGRERYTRYLKALVQVGGARDETYGARVGQRIEIVPEANPVFVEPGGVLPVVIWFDGAPVAGVRVEAFSRDAADAAHVRAASYTTDAAGRIRVAIDRRGAWLLRLTHMVRCAGCADADWESFWGAYTFASADPSGRVVAAPPMLAPSGGGKLRIAGAIAAGAALVAAAIYVLRRRRRRR
jgi:uncharacterized GH25 family protein